jgi:transposase InsO family protein
MSGHLGMDKTLERLARVAYWPNMDQSVREYVRTCDSCQRNKPTKLKPPGLLQPLPIPTRNRESVSMDFIVHLPKTASGYDAIITVVDRFSKMAHFIPTHTNATAADTAKLFFNLVVRFHSIPASIVSDRDSKFTSNFWKALFKLADTKLAMSTSRHPQTDGQTERMNRTLEEMLRSYVNSDMTNWDDLLPAVEFAYNDSTQASSGMTPFFANYGFHPHSPLGLLSRAQACACPSAGDFVARIQAAATRAKERLQQAQQRMAHYYDQRRRPLTFKVGDLVKLSEDAIGPSKENKPPARKMAGLFRGPFVVTEVISPLAYRIKLPPKSRAHDVFSVQYLLPYRSRPGDEQRDAQRAANPPPVSIDELGNAYWQVDSIIGEAVIDGETRYLVRWTGYSSDDDSYEPRSGIGHTDAFKAYQARKRREAGAQS